MLNAKGGGEEGAAEGMCASQGTFSSFTSYHRYLIHILTNKKGEIVFYHSIIWYTPFIYFNFCESLSSQAAVLLLLHIKWVYGSIKRKREKYQSLAHLVSSNF